MFTKTITYTDYNGVERTEKFFFNLTKSELIDMEISTPGGFTAYLQKIIDSKDYPTIAGLFKKLIFMSYGVKSDDGRQFIKSDEISKAFSQTPAFDQMYMEFATNADAGAEFVNGLIPSDMTEAVNKALLETANKEDNDNVVTLPDKSNTVTI